ncbi:SDR family oxidoreductase [Acidithiobacillus ferrivorans]|nr:SDR family oxidoreductase [Acidithiobacillus ferrivorans]
MKICLTGSSGLLGGAVRSACAGRGWECKALGRDLVDFRHPMGVQEALRGYDVLIHAAANTNVEACEADPEMCFKDNALLTEVMAAAAVKRGVRFVFISSTGVYGDYLGRPYNEYDRVLPTTHHHMAKRCGEKSVLRASDSLVVRTGWLFGGSFLNRKNFVVRRIEEAVQSNGVIHSNSEQRGSPTYVKDVAVRLLQMIEDRQHGVFNCVNEGFASRLEYVSKIIEYAGISANIIPSLANSFNRRAKVSNNETALNLKMRQCGYDVMPNWEESLMRYFKEELCEFISGFHA